MKIKICGLKRMEDIDYVNHYLPDYIGFVFASSKRQVDLIQAKQLKAKLNQKIKAVGVFVNQDIEYITTLANLHIIDLIQLHGQEEQNYINELKKQTTLPIIKAICMKDENSYETYQNIDYYLLDSRQAGSGQTFDWKWIKQLDKPIFLAGGIDDHNIDQALKQNVYSLDVSSGVETNGVKDEKKIEKLIRRIRHDKG